MLKNLKINHKFIKILLVLTLFFSLIPFFVKSEQSWDNSTFTYRQSINISNNNDTDSLTDYQINLTIDTSTPISAGKMQSDCDDIRFYNSTGSELNYWIQENCSATDTLIWVKIPSIPIDSTETIYMYYGNPTAVNKSNGNATFIFFDDFNDSSIDWSKWQNNSETNANNWTEEDGVLKQLQSRQVGDNVEPDLYYKNGFAWTDYIFEGKVYANTSAYPGVFVRVNDTNIAQTTVWWHEWNTGTEGSTDTGTLRPVIYDSDKGWAYTWTGTTDTEEGVWRTFRADVWGANYKSYLNGIVVNDEQPVTAANRVMKGTVGLGQHKGQAWPQVVYFDDVRVRQYAPVEPTYTIGSEETRQIELNFTFPTPSNNSYINQDNTTINITIDESKLDTFIFNWNSTNYTFYDDTLLMMFNFDNKSSIGENDSDVIDTSKWSRNGSMYYGAIHNKTGRYGLGMNFDGIDDFINTTLDSCDLNNTDFTVTGWFYSIDDNIEDFSGAQRIMTSWRYVPSTRWCITLDDNKFAIGHGGCALVSGGSTIQIDRWYHFAFIYNGTGIRGYLNGILDSELSTTLEGGCKDVLKIGAFDPDGSGLAKRIFNGTLDEIRIWNRTLTADEINMSYKSNLEKFNHTRWIFTTNQSLTDGEYTYYAGANDTSGNWNNTETRLLTIDTIESEITLIKPDNYYNISSSTNYFNYSVTELNLDTCELWTNISGTFSYNQTQSARDNFTVENMPDTTFFWNVYCNDSTGNGNWSANNRTMTVDTDELAVTLVYPTDNLLTALTNITFNYSVVEINLDTCELWHNISGTFNFNQTVQTNPANFTIPNLPDKQIKWNIRCNDTANNVEWGSSNYTFIVDTTSPRVNFTYPTPANNSYINQGNTTINLTINEMYNLDTFIFNWNTTNYTFYNDDLVLMMNFNNVTSLGENGTYVVDMSKYSNNGTCDIASGDCPVINSTGKYGGGAHFDGDDDYININDSSSLDLTKNITIEAWIKPEDLNDYEAIVSKRRDATANYLFRLEGVTTSGRLGFWYNGGSYHAYTTGSILSANVWQHVAITYISGDTNSAKIYLNGIEQSGSWTTGDGTESLVANTEPVQIGRSELTGDSMWFDGMVDEVAVYNRTLSADEINMSYKSNLEKYNSTRYIFYSNQSYLSDDTYTYFSWANDSVGNQNQTETRTLTVDTTAPNATLISPANNTIEINGTQNFTVNISDNLGIKNATLRIYDELNNLVNETTETFLGGVLEITLGIVVKLVDGIYTWFYEIFDWAGNVFSTENRTIIIDSILPRLELVNPTPANNSYITQDNTTINITIDEDYIDTFIFNWNTTNYTFYNPNDLVLMMNFNNNSVEGEAKEYTLDSSMVAWYHLNNDSTYGENDTHVYDFSGNQNNGTVEGAVVNSSGKFDSALSFDGADDYITMSDSASLDLDDDNQFTLEAWIKLDGLTGDWQVITGRWYDGETSDQSYGIELYANTRRPQVVVWGTSQTSCDSNYVINYNQWYHVAGTYDGSNLKIYVDGVQKNSCSYSSGIAATNAPLTIGRWTKSTDKNPFNGTIDEVAIYNRSLSADDITQHAGILARDYSKYGNNGTLNGTTGTTGKYGSAIEFSEKTGWANISYSDSLNITEELSIEAWIYSNVAADHSQVRRIVSKDASYVFQYDSTNAGYQATIVIYEAGGTYVQCGSSYALKDNEWVHFASTFNRTDIISYENGVQVKSCTFADKLINGNNNPVYIGTDPASLNYDFNGTIDELRIWKKALSADEINISYKSNLHYHNSTRWVFYSNQTLVDGNYTYFAWANDTLTVQNETETRLLIVDTTLPSITITSPTEGTTYNGVMLITTSITEATTNIDYAYFNITNQSGQLETEGNLNLSENWNATFNTSKVGDGNYVLNVFANDSANNAITTTVNFKIDHTNPTISWTLPSSDNSTYFALNERVDLTFSDANLFETSINITNSTGEVYYNSTYDLNVSSQQYTDMLNNSDGNYTIEASVSDDHTRSNTDLQKHKKGETILIFNSTTSGVTITASFVKKNDKADNIPTDFVSSVSELTDEGYYKFGYNFTVGRKGNKLKLNISSTKNLIYREPKSGIRSHFVWDKYYMDYDDLPSNTNLTVTQLSDSNYIITIEGEEEWAKNDFIEIDPVAGGLNIITEYATFVYDATEPAITLDTPNDYLNTTTANWSFNYSVIENNLDTCEFYHNITGTFTFNQSTSLSNFTLNNLGDKTLIWNVKCNDTAGNNNWSSKNYTLTIDTTTPTITLTSPTNNTGDSDGTITFNYNTTDYSYITNCSLIIDDAVNQTNSSITKNTTQNFTLNLDTASYNWSINCTDISNNVGSTETRIISIIPSTDFSGDTTDLTEVNVSNITNLIIDSPDYGKINFVETVDLSAGADINTYVNISSNRLELNSTALSVLNKSARLTLYNLTYSNPRILKDNIVCSDCTEVSYSSGTLIFDVTSFTVYVAEETPTNPPSGGGGTSISEGPSSKKKEEKEIQEFEVNPESFNIDIAVGEVSYQQISIYNSNDINLEVTIDIVNLEDSIIIKEKTITIKPKESKIIKFDAITPKEPGIYTGKIILTAGETVKEILITLNIQSKEKSLFDISVDIPDVYKEIKMGNKLSTQITLIQAGLQEKMDVTLNYMIKDFEGKTYLKESETLAVFEQKSYKKEFQTQNLKSKDYIIGVEVIYPTGMATASSQFTILGDRFTTIDLLVSIVFVAVVFVFITLIKLTKKYKKELKNIKKVRK